MKVKKLVTHFRIQAERTINGINSFHVLKGVLEDKLLHLIDNIFEKCSSLCSLKPEIIQKKLIDCFIYGNFQQQFRYVPCNIPSCLKLDVKLI